MTSRVLLALAGAISGGLCVAAGVYMATWDSAASGTLDLGDGTAADLTNNWYELTARGLGIFMIGVGICIVALAWYLVARLGRVDNATGHLERIALYTYEALDDDEGIPPGRTR